jgi:hypothetical protein
VDCWLAPVEAGVPQRGTGQVEPSQVASVEGGGLEIGLAHPDAVEGESGEGQAGEVLLVERSFGQQVRCVAQVDDDADEVAEGGDLVCRARSQQQVFELVADPAQVDVLGEDAQGNGVRRRLG